ARSVAYLRSISAHAHRSRLDWKTLRLFRNRGFPSNHFHIFGSQLLVARPPLICVRETASGCASAPKQFMEIEAGKLDESLQQIDLGREISAVQDQLQEIARAEMARQRRRLGKLSPEQESAVEALLISALNKISHPVIQQMQRSFEDGHVERVSIWREVFVARH